MLFGLFKGRKSDGDEAKEREENKTFAEEFLERRAERQRAALERDAQRNMKKRIARRADCFTPAAFHIPDSGVRFDGVITDASSGGASFRPASNFIQDMTGEKVHLSCEGVSRTGVVRATRPDGYGIQVFEPFTDEELTAIKKATIDIALGHAA